jgi:hypothetical protein
MAEDNMYANSEEQPLISSRYLPSEEESRKALPFLSVLSNLHALDSTHSSHFINPSSTRSALLSFTSSHICHPFFSLCVHFNFFTRSAISALLIHVFLLRSLLVIPSIHLSMLLCVHSILRSILEFSIQVSRLSSALS